MKDAIQFKVTVTAIIEREQTVGKDWAVIAKEPKTPDDKIASEKYGYTPEITKVVRKDQQIFEQTVDALDMAALVGVVNGLPAR